VDIDEKHIEKKKQVGLTSLPFFCSNTIPLFFLEKASREQSTKDILNTKRIR